MTISIEYYYCSSRVVAGFFQEVALLILSFVLRWLLLPWSRDEEREAAEDAGVQQQQHRWRHHHHQPAAAQEVRESLQVATYGEVAAAAAATTCAVCLCEVGRRDRVWELRNCHHVFHKACLDRWLDHDEHLSCPLCRAPLRPAASPPPAASEPSWPVERLLYLFGDDLPFTSPPS